LISPARWEAAQKIILEKGDRWTKTRRARSSVLLNGLLRCACGKACYARYSTRTYYYCSSGFPRSPKCGAPSVQQEAADRIVIDSAGQFADPAFIPALLGPCGGYAARPRRRR
jgi:hypothetical protein